MTHSTLNTRINKYIGKVKPIAEGERNPSLYNIGLLLRTRFGLTGDALASALSEANQKKCTPPLVPDEVSRIAQSVDESDVALGASNNTSNGRRFKKTPVPKQRTEYTISASADSVTTESLLQKVISIYPHCQNNIPSGTITVKQFLNDCKNAKYREPVEAIRTEEDKEQRSKLKNSLACVTIQSEPCEQRKRKFCKNNAVVCLDFDDIDDVEDAKQKIAGVPYVFAVVISAGGRGVFALAALTEPVVDLKSVLEAMQPDFEFPIDEKCSDLSRFPVRNAWQYKPRQLPPVPCQRESKAAEGSYRCCCRSQWNHSGYSNR